MPCVSLGPGGAVQFSAGGTGNKIFTSASGKKRVQTCTVTWLHFPFVCTYISLSYYCQRKKMKTAKAQYVKKCKHSVFFCKCFIM